MSDSNRGRRPTPPEVNLEYNVNNPNGCFDFIAAILINALLDATNLKMQCQAGEARRFIDPNNWLFKYYCGLIGSDAELIADNLWKSIRETDGRKRARSSYQTKKRFYSLCPEVPEDSYKSGWY